MKPFWSYLIQERRSCQNSYIMKHDLSGRFWTETLNNFKKTKRDRERKTGQCGLSHNVWENWSNMKWLHQITARSSGKQRHWGRQRDILQVIRLAAGGICVDFQSLLKLLHIPLLHRHLPLDQKYVLEREQATDQATFGLFMISRYSNLYKSNI